MGATLSKPMSKGRRETAERLEFRQIAHSAQLGTVTRSRARILAQNLPWTGLIGPTEAHLLVTLINTASAQSFDKGGMPIVFKSNRALAFEIGRSEGRVSRLLSKLYDRGLITMEDSGNYKRYPVRNEASEITDACGIDLRIIIARYSELEESVRRARAEHEARCAAVHRYRGGLRKLRNCLAAASSIPDWLRHRVCRRLDRIAAYIGSPARAHSTSLRRATTLFEQLCARLFGVKSNAPEAFETAEMTCPYVENDKHIQITNPYQSVSGNDERRSANAEQPQFDQAGYASKEASEKSLMQRPAPVKRESAQQMVSLTDLVRATPAVQEYGLATPRSWPELARHVPLLCKFAGISEDARLRAVQQMGEQAAAVAIALTFQKFEDKHITSPGGYLRAMTDRAAAGTLQLARSVHGLAARSYPGALH